MVRLLNKLKNIPATPLGITFCDLTIMSIASELKDWALTDETWQRVQKRSKFMIRFPELLAATYAVSLTQRGHYSQAIQILDTEQFRPRKRNRNDQLAHDRARIVLLLTHLRCGHLPRAAELLGDFQRRNYKLHPTLKTSALLAEAHLHYMSGEQELSKQSLERIPEINPRLDDYSRALQLCSLARAQARCGLVEQAEKAMLGDPPKRFTPLLRERRLLALATIACASQDSEIALSYIRDLQHLQIVDGEIYLKAAALSQGDIQRGFLNSVLQLDPESHWAKVASRKLDKLQS